jgi:hypothetical protein
MTMISEKRNPFDRINLATVIKITDFNWYSHSAGDNPYIQISINGLVLCGTGEVLDANIQDSAPHGDYEKVNELVTLYTPRSLHWVESYRFSFTDEALFFHHPTNTHLVDAEDIAEINYFFNVNIPSDSGPQKQPEKITTSNVCPDLDKHSVVISGSLEHVDTALTKKGKKMAFARLHDENGFIDLIIFTNVYDDYEKTVSKGCNVSVTGILDVSESSAYLIPERFEVNKEIPTQANLFR